MAVFSLTSYNYFYFLGSGGTPWVQPETPQLWMIGDNNSGQIGDGSQQSWGRSVTVQLPGSWSMVSTGADHTLAIKSDGTLWSWGSNGVGQLGIIGPAEWAKISMGSNHVLGLKSDGTLWGWGYNAQGELGDGTTTNKSSPVQIGTSTWKDVAAGNGHSSGINYLGQLFTWGYGPSGELGNGANRTIARSSPTQVTTPLSSWTQVAAGNATFAITTLGALWVTGQGNGGLTGLGTTTARSTFAAIGTSSWTQINTNQFTAAGITPDKKLFMWGIGSSGQRGDNTTINRSSPVQIGGSWNQVDCGYSHTVATKADSTLWVWGYNLQYQLGTGVTANKSSPTQVGVGSSFTMVAASQSASYAIGTDNWLWAWGGSFYGQQANGTTNSNLTPTKITSPYSQVFAGGAGTVFAGNLNRQVSAAGFGSQGQLGGLQVPAQTNTTLQPIALITKVDSRSSPVQVGTNTNWSRVYAGSGTSFAITNDTPTAGKLFVWGGNGFGRLGFNESQSTRDSRSSPAQLGTGNWKSVATGGYITAAIDSNDRLFTWGYGGDGQLGDGNTGYRSSPVQVGTFGTSSWTQVAVPITGQSLYAIQSTGALYDSGSNASGELGINSTINRSTLGAVTNSYSFTQISAGHLMAFGVTNDNMLLGWGNNTDGRLGNSQTTNRSTPAQIASDKQWRKVAAGTGTAFAETTDGYVWGWGQNVFYGTLETGDKINYSSPVQISSASQGAKVFTSQTTVAYLSPYVPDIYTFFATGRNASGALGQGDTVNRSSIVQVGSVWKKFSIGDDFGIGIKPNGTLWAWGTNNYGQLGNNTTVSRSDPIQVGTSSNWTFVHAAQLTGYAINSSGQLWAWGYNGTGQLGISNTINRSSPVQVGAQTYWTHVGGKAQHTLAINNVGGLFTWGYGDFGELGQGSFARRSSPVQVNAGTSYKYATGASGISAVIRHDGYLYVCGANNTGQLGLGDTVTRTTFTAPSTLSPVTHVTTWSGTGIGIGGMFAIEETNNRLMGWGSNSYRVVVDAAGVAYSTPGALSTGWSKVEAATYLTGVIGMKTDGTIWAWGNNAYGQLGDGTTANRSSPVQISTQSWSDVVGGYRALGARKSL